MKPIVVISDVHGNLPAIESVYDDILELVGYSFDTIVLGDLIDYGSHSNECVDFIAEKFNPKVMILGNHEDAIIGNGRPSRTDHGRVSYEYTKRVLGEVQRSYLERDMVRIYQDSDILAFHGYLEDAWTGTTIHTNFPKDDLGDSSLVLYGHTHLQSMIEKNGAKFVNPGSVGQPRNGDSRAQYAIVLDDKVDLRRVDYDIDMEAASILEAGLPRFLATRLYLGI